MVNWKTELNPINLQNHGVYNNILVYDTITGNFIEKNRSNIPDMNNKWIGFYKKHNDDYLGVFASDNGPVFFMNASRYLLGSSNWEFIVNEQSNHNEFVFKLNGNTIYQTDYQKVEQLWTNPYEDEEFVDFFKWLASKKDSMNFINHYTIAIEH